LQRDLSGFGVLGLDDARFNRIGVLQTISAAASGSLQLFHIADIEIGKNDIAMGLETGADDFLAKPVNAHELRARITAGERILSMERELHSRNAIITDTLSELRKLYHAIDIDLIEAKKLQHSLIREPNVSVGSYKITQFLQSAGHVGGIWLACFPRVSDIWDCLELMCRAMASARLSLRRVWRAIYPLARQSITSHLVQVRMALLGRCPPRKCLRP